MKRMLLLVPFFISGCAVGPNYHRPAMHLPNAFPSSTATIVDKAQRFQPNKTIPAQWWRLFHSKPLNKLVAISFQKNPSIKAAQSALHGALENIYVQQAAFYPFVGFAFNPAKQQTAKLLTSVLASNQYNYSLYTGQVFVSYTPDVFGGVRRQLESLVALAQLQRFQLEATYLTLSSNVVNAAIQEASLRAQIKATQDIIVSQRKMIGITRKRLALGDAAVADLALQETALATSEATLPPLQKQLEIQRDLLNALTGRFPDDKSTPAFTLDELTLPRDLPISLPSRLLEQRPDIRAAEEQMHAANALIGVAVANRLPNVTIGFTNAGTAATELSSLLQPDTLFWSLAGIITQPIFDANALLHKQRYAQAIYEQTAAQYRLTIINAFQNVADTLKSIRLDAIALRAMSKAERAAYNSLSISRRQFSLGDASSLDVLINEQFYQQAKINLIQAKANRLSDTVALFQALGGGW